MKKRLAEFIFLILSTILVLSSISLVHSKEIMTSKAITGNATSSFNASITVSNAGPAITIYSPKDNRTYRNSSILLNYTLVDEDGISAAWYNINGTNVSLGNSTSNYIYFSASEGNKTLYLYSNDTLGLLRYDSVNFYVNNTKLIIIYENFRENKKGNSNDFDSYSEQVLENFSNMTLENTDYGKIVWNERINLTADINASDKITTLDNYVIISNQSIYVNLTELPNLNKSATLRFYNLSFDDPRVLIDGEVCPETICSDESYSGGTLSIVVTRFSNFTLEETPESPIVPGGGGGGGGGGETEEIQFSYNPKTIKMSLTQGKKSEVEIDLENFDERNIYFDLSSNVKGVSLSENNFLLKPEQEKVIIAFFNAALEPGIYYGYLTIQAETLSKKNKTEKIPVVFVVNSETKIFDVSLQVLPEYKRVYPGESVYAQIDLYNLGSTQDPIDVKLVYMLQDYNGVIISKGSESIAVHTKMSSIKNLIVPLGTKSGNYLFNVNATYEGYDIYASDSFMVQQLRFPQLNMDNLFWLYILLALLILILVILYIIRERRNHKKRR